jgi:hypothetical protein
MLVSAEETTEKVSLTAGWDDDQRRMGEGEQKEPKTMLDDRWRSLFSNETSQVLEKSLQKHINCSIVRPLIPGHYRRLT